MTTTTTTTTTTAIWKTSYMDAMHYYDYSPRQTVISSVLFLNFYFYFFSHVPVNLGDTIYTQSVLWFGGCFIYFGRSWFLPIITYFIFYYFLFFVASLGFHCRARVSERIMHALTLSTLPEYSSFDISPFCRLLLHTLLFVRNKKLRHIRDTVLVAETCLELVMYLRRFHVGRWHVITKIPGVTSRLFR